MPTMSLRGAKRRGNLRGNENVFVFSNPLKEYGNKGVLMFFQYGRLGSTWETEHISYVNILLWPDFLTKKEEAEKDISRAMLK